MTYNNADISVSVIFWRIYMIKCFKLVTGETVISEFQDSDEVYDFIKPALVVPFGNDVDCYPFPALVDLSLQHFKDCVMPKRSVAYEFIPDERVIQKYNLAVTKIIVPQNQTIY